MFCKITNLYECHFGHQYHDGLNILKGPFNENLNSNGRGGFYFTTSNEIHNFYPLGCFLRIVEIPTYLPGCKVVKIGNQYRTNMIIFKQKYSFEHDLREILKINTHFYYFMNLACKTGKVNILENLKGFVNIECDKFMMLYASEFNHLNILEWFLQNNFRSDIQENVNDIMTCAAYFNHITLLIWLKNKKFNMLSGLNALIIFSLQRNNLNVIYWMFEHFKLGEQEISVLILYAFQNKNDEIITILKHYGYHVKNIERLKKYNENVFEWLNSHF